MVALLLRQVEARSMPLWLAVGASITLLSLGQFGLVHGPQAAVFLNAGGVGLIACLALSELRRRSGETEIVRLREAAITDPLTGVGNRRSFEQDVTRRIATFRRFQTPCSLLVIDADHFKAINDTYGHDVGDLVLKSVVRSIQATLRDIDILFRMGGEEFVAVLPETEAANAKIAAERIRSAVSQLRVAVNGQLLKVTVSQGGAQLTTADDLGTWLKRADQALYEAKRNGRNRVVIEMPEAEQSSASTLRAKRFTRVGT